MVFVAKGEDSGIHLQAKLILMAHSLTSLNCHHSLPYIEKISASQYREL
jgi:hypothetical protein